MKKFLVILLAFLLVLYLAGPKPSEPQLAQGPSWTFPDSLTALDDFLAQEEGKYPHIKAENEAKILWADSLNPSKTAYVVLYVHGFSASEMEGAPLNRAIAKHLGANLLLARLADHGLQTSDTLMANASAEAYYQSVENYYALAQRLGKKVVVLGTSFGGALSLKLASRHPEIAALALYGPCIKIADPYAELLDNPWGLQLARLITGGPLRSIPKYSEKHERYWSLSYRLEGVVALQNFLSHTMNAATFEQVKVPCFIGYYYQDEEHQDQVVSVPAIREMASQLGTPAKWKEEKAFPWSGNHVITSDVLGKRVDLPINASIAFLDRVLKP